LIAIFATLLFSSAPAGIRAVGLDAFALGICRLGLASLGMTALLAWHWPRTREHLRQWNRRTTRALLLVGLTFGVHWALFFVSIKLGGAAIGAIGYSTYGVHLIVLGWVFGRGRVTAIDVVGLLLAAVGTWLLMPEFSLGNAQTLGLVIGILSGLACAFLPLLHQHYADIDGNLRAWGQFTFALVVFACLQPWAHWEQLDAGDVPLILYLGLVVAFIGHGMWVHATTALSTTTTSILSYLYLPLSLVMTSLTLGEQLSGRAMLGTALVLVANALVLGNGRRRGTLSLGRQALDP